ncbi:MAG: hypothetical protein U5K31_15265 [Balneolaceae bacterium]|nr:hypothetical protein [Balneolaceae bacterium]
MRYALCLFLALLLASCHAPQNEQTLPPPHTDEMVDLRIGGDGTMLFNGNRIHDSALASHVRALHTGEMTRARMIISEEAPTGLVMKATSLLYGQGVRRISSKLLSPSAYRDYDRHHLHVDILSDGRIFYRGHELFPADLATALRHADYSDSVIAVLSVGDTTRVGPVTDVQEILRDREIMRVNYSDI